MAEVRICHTEDLPMVIQVTEEGEVSGLFAQYAREGYELMLRGTNATFKFHKNNGFGSKIDDSDKYDGCIGKLQRNESDLLWILTRYPLLAENVTEGAVLSESGVTFISVYYDKELVDQKITQSFRSFHTSVWLSIALALAIIWFLLRVSVFINSSFKFLQCLKRAYKSSPRDIRQRVTRLRRRLIGRHKNLFFKVLVHFSRIDMIDTFSPSSRVIFAVLSLMSLVVVHYFLSSIKTEMVVIPFPDLYETYEDIERENALPLFFSGFNTEQNFEYAERDSPEYSMWQYVKSRNVSESLIAKSGSWDHFFKNTDAVVERSLVMFTDELLAPIIKKCACLCQAKDQKKMFEYLEGGKALGMRLAYRQPQELPAFRILVKSDPGSHRHLVGAIFSSHMSSHIFSRVKKTLAVVLEAGLISVQLDRALKRDWLEGFGAGRSQPDRMHFMDECMRESVFMQEPSFSPLAFKQISSFVLYCLISVMLAAAFAIAEHSF